MRPLALTAASGCRAALSRTSCAQAVLSKRTFTSLPTLRPSLPASSASRPAFRSPTTNTLSRLPITPTPTTTFGAGAGAVEGAAVADIVPKSSITSHPAFGFQIRCGPRPNLERSSRLVRKRRHGFLSRLRTRTGRKILQRRKAKGRSVLSM